VGKFISQAHAVFRLIVGKPELSLFSFRHQQLLSILLTHHVWNLKLISGLDHRTPVGVAVHAAVRRATEGCVWRHTNGLRDAPLLVKHIRGLSYRDCSHGKPRVAVSVSDYPTSYDYVEAQPRQR
jgi:hypothetical protein